METGLDKSREMTNSINDMEGYSDAIEGYKSFLDTSIRNTLAMALTRGKPPMSTSEWDRLDTMKKQLDLLENYTV